MKNKVIVITGASGGIGAALAEQVGQAGAQVVLAARRESELKQVAAKLAGPSEVVVADVTKRADVERLCAQAIKRFGHIDVWVNNAGRGISKLPSQLTDQDLDDMMLLNVKSALYGMQAVLPHFKERRAGQIINISSLLGRVPFAAIRTAYSASKHALNALTSGFRMELAAEYPDIKVTLVSPGVVATDFGNNALHGGMDSRKIPGAQSATEVAAVIAEVIAAPRADSYTRPDHQAMIVSYFSAPDLAAVEAKFGMTLPPPAGKA